MKKLLFCAAVVLLYAQMLQATPTNTVIYNTGIRGTSMITAASSSGYGGCNGRNDDDNVKLTEFRSVGNGDNDNHNVNTISYGGTGGTGGYTTTTTLTKTSGNDFGNAFNTIGNTYGTTFGNSGQGGQATTVSKSGSSSSGGLLGSVLNFIPRLFGKGGQTTTEVKSPGTKDRNDNDDNNGRERKGNDNQQATWPLGWQNGIGGDGDKNCNHGKGSTSNCDIISKQLEAAYAEIASLKSQLQSSNNNYFVLENKLTQITVESNSWRSKYELNLKTLQQLQEINAKLDFNLRETQTTVTTLQNNIEQVKINARGNEKELLEWRNKYDILLVDSENSKRNVRELTTINNELRNNAKETNDKLISCQRESGQLWIDITTYKTTIENNKQLLNNCEFEKANLEKDLQSEIKKFNEDEKRDYEDARHHKKVEAELSRCQTQLTESKNNYENDIRNLQISIQQYKFQIKTEVDLKNACTIENKNYVVNMREIQNQLDLSRKTAIEGQSQKQQCQDEFNKIQATFNVLQRSYDDLNKVVNDVTTQLNNCNNRSSSITIELNACESNKNSCWGNLDEIKGKWKIAENRIIQLENDNGSLISNKKQCEADLSILRCDTNKYLETVRRSQNDSYNKLQQLPDMFERTRNAIKNFIVEKNISCPQLN